MTFLIFSLLAACTSKAPEAAQNDAAVDLPQPSGPPLAQQLPADGKGPDARMIPVWEAFDRGNALLLYLKSVAGPEGALHMVLGCKKSSPEIVVHVSSFTQIGSEDRLTLGLGDEAVTIVADPPAQGNPGVTGQGAVPSNFAEALERAEVITAVYGAQQAGPYPAPSPQLREKLAAICSGKA